MIQTEKQEHVVTVTFDRAEKMNPLGAPGDGEKFAKVCDEINLNLDVRCVILTGAGRAFSAGGDIKAMKARSSGWSSLTHVPINFHMNRGDSSGRIYIYIYICHLL